MVYSFKKEDERVVRRDCMNHDESVAFFNKKITEEGFVITSESLFKTHLESLMLSGK